MSSEFIIREIEKHDIKAVARIIKDTLTEFGAVGAGYSINDEEIDDMFEAYAKERAVYYVIVKQDKIYGCGGLAQLDGASDDICELRKMYFLESLRGLGYGQKLLDLILEKAREFNYKRCYLETLERMEIANKLYKKNGFERLKANEGNTGHSSCDAYYVKQL